MQDTFNREINYLRISVTDRCNMRCVYCMPEGGIDLTSSDNILKFEEILEIVKAAVHLGIRKVRLTGGEPLVRTGLVNFINELNQIPEIDDIALTTNGVLLPKYAESLKKAGLNRVNISLDTLKKDKFREITRIGNLEEVWLGIKTALATGFAPVKINTVVIKGRNADEIVDFAKLTMDLPLHVRYIELMPIGVSDVQLKEAHMPISEMKERLNVLGKFEPIKRLDGNGPAKYYQFPGAQGTIGFISAISSHFCDTCNRLRLTSEGQLRPCLHSCKEIDLKTPLRKGASREDLIELIAEGIKVKPDRHTMASEGWKDNKRIMSQIGG